MFCGTPCRMNIRFHASDSEDRQLAEGQDVGLLRLLEGDPEELLTGEHLVRDSAVGQTHVGGLRPRSHREVDKVQLRRGSSGHPTGVLHNLIDFYITHITLHKS